MRRILAAGLLAVMLTATACSKSKAATSNGKPPTSAVKSAPAGPVTLKVLDTGEFTAVDALITAFYQQNANVRVEKVAFQPPGGDPRPYEIALFNEHKVDIVPGNFVSPMMGVDKFLDLEPYIQKSRLDLTALGSDPEPLRLQGRLYELPYAVQPDVVIYNKAMFQAARLPFPQAGWTWDQFRETAAKLTHGNGDDKVWGFGPRSTDSLATMYKNQESPARLILPDDDALKEMLRLFGTMILTDRSVPPSTTQDATVPQQDMSHINDFVNGRAAMTVDSLQRFQQQFGQPSFPWDVVPMPTKAGAKTKGSARASSFAIAANTPDPEAAWAFVRFAVSPAGATALAKVGYLPVYTSQEVRQSWLDLKPAPPAGTAVLFDMKWTAMPHYWDDRVLTTIYDAYTKAIQDTLSGRASWEDAYADYRRVVLTTH